MGAVTVAVALAGVNCATAQRPRGKGPGPEVSSAQVWPVKTREHIDLWLHAFALLQDDTTHVPLFARGYRDRMTVLKNQQGVLTLLDKNADKLKDGFAHNRALAGAQFFPLYVGNWDDLVKVVNAFLAADGDPRRASSREGQIAFQVLGESFQTGPERDWLKLFLQSLGDERDKFYHVYWLQQERQRDSVITVVDSLWQKVYRPKMQPFLNNTQQLTGDLFLSLPLEGEGRTLNFSPKQNEVAVPLPATVAEAPQAIYVFAHEVSGNLVAGVVADNTTPNEKRLGVADRYISAGQVIGGYALIEKTAPELAEGYARFYLRAAAAPEPAAGEDLKAALYKAFPLPDLLRDGIARQMTIVLGGI